MDMVDRIAAAIEDAANKFTDDDPELGCSPKMAREAAKAALTAMNFEIAERILISEERRKFYSD